MKNNETMATTPVRKGVGLELDSVLELLRAAESDGRRQAELAVRILFETLGQDFDDDYNLMLPKSFREVVERLRNLPYMTKELSDRVMLDEIGLLSDGKALVIRRDTMKGYADLPPPTQFKKGLYNGKK